MWRGACCCRGEWRPGSKHSCALPRPPPRAESVPLGCPLWGCRVLAIVIMVKACADGLPELGSSFPIVGFTSLGEQRGQAAAGRALGAAAAAAGMPAAADRRASSPALSPHVVVCSQHCGGLLSRGICLLPASHDDATVRCASLTGCAWRSPCDGGWCAAALPPRRVTPHCSRPLRLPAGRLSELSPGPKGAAAAAKAVDITVLGTALT